MMLLLLFLLTVSPRVWANPRVIGSQDFQLGSTLFQYGGLSLFENGSVEESHLGLRSVDLRTEFGPTSGPLTTNLKTPNDIPNVSHGFMFSNAHDRAWLWGGQSNDNITLDDSIWRFAPDNEEQPWSRLAPSQRAPRVRSGAGCNVPRKNRAYYIGGVISDSTYGSSPQYVHQLVIFDMANETFVSYPIPSDVPVFNQVLLHINTDMTQGALVVLSGEVEAEGGLELASLSKIWIYDIDAETWTMQRTSGLSPTLPEDTTFRFESSEALPMRRMKACAAAASSQDQSSHHIILLGGQNNGSSISDAWSLSLPSMVWIKHPLDRTNGPRDDGSCILLNARFVAMNGGCYAEKPAGRSCIAYSYDNLIYDMTNLGWSNFMPNTYGYSVPKNLSDLIGGDAMGRARARSPMFGSFASPALEALFRPPAYNESHGAGLEFSNEVVATTLTCLLLPLSCYLIFMFLSTTNTALSKILPLFAKRISQFLRHVGQLRISRKPWPRQRAFMVLLMSYSSVLIILVAYLWHQSSHPDPNPANWLGGLESAGTWSDPDKRFTSWFSPAPNSGRPPRGLLSVYFDEGNTGVWSQRNWTIRLSKSALWGITYLQGIVFLAYGRLWKLIDVEIKRLMPLAALRHSKGSSAESSLLLSYHNFWTPLAILQALRYQHWTVVVSSTGMLLSAYFLPIIANYALTWQRYSGAWLEWGDQNTWMIAYVDPTYAKVLIVLLVVTLVGAISLLATDVILDLPETDSACGSFAKVKELVLDIETTTQAEDLGLGLDSATISLSDLKARLKGSTYQVVSPTTGSHQEQLRKAPGHAPPPMPPASCIGTALKQFVNPIITTIESHPYFFMMIRLVFILWLAFLLCLLGLNIYLYIMLDLSGRSATYNYTIPIPADVFIVLAIFVQSIVDVIEDNVRHLYVPVTLALNPKSPQPPSLLFQDYSAAGIPIWEVIPSLLDRQFPLAVAQLSSLATMTYTVFFGSLQLSASDYGATSFYTDLIATRTAAVLMGVIVLLNLVIGAYYVLRKPLLEQQPDTLAAKIALVLRAPLLREDLRDVQALGDSRRKIEELKRKGRRYALDDYDLPPDATGSVTTMFGVEKR